MNFGLTSVLIPLSTSRYEEMLADFGLAKATAWNDIKSCKGTPYWMAPEVIFIFLNLLFDCIVYRLGMLLFSSIIIIYYTSQLGWFIIFIRITVNLVGQRKMVL
ncbi:putative mitogen-activated protein kinase kinase kinase [Helianthus anomalus]